MNKLFTTKKSKILNSIITGVLQINKIVSVIVIFHPFDSRIIKEFVKILSKHLSDIYLHTILKKEMIFTTRLINKFELIFVITLNRTILDILFRIVTKC